MKKKSVHLQKIGDVIAKKTGIPKKDFHIIVEALCIGIADTLKNGDTVYLPELGRMAVHPKAERMARNPRTGEPAVVPAHSVVRFHPGAALKRHLNKD